MDTYLLLKRAEIVERSAARLSRRRRELFVVDRIDEETGRMSGVLAGDRRTFTIARMPAGLRAITVREGGRGLESLVASLTCKDSVCRRVSTAIRVQGARECSREMTALREIWCDPCRDSEGTVRSTGGLNRLCLQ
ncbi:hypothetical protein [Embleya sp. NPDC005575]|uniref:hypothetical protein n=1 Tax=Embleya sp. NPDC005575 TaxID=3156892 RepID=UPI0033BB23A4